MPYFHRPGHISCSYFFQQSIHNQLVDQKFVDGIEADEEGNRPLLVNWMAFQHASKVTRLLK